jgi:hypothetical protein
VEMLVPKLYFAPWSMSFCGLMRNPSVVSILQGLQKQKQKQKQKQNKKSYDLKLLSNSGQGSIDVFSSQHI